MMYHRRSRISIFLVALSFASCGVAVANTPPDFRRDIKPLFESSCIDCHGPKKQRSGYRLDVRPYAMKGGDIGETAIVAGDSGKSTLVRHITSADDDVLMPPPKSGKPRLTAEQVSTIRKWIDAGAIWPDEATATAADPLDWWSLKPLAKPAVPSPTVAAKSANPIDTFIVARLAEKSLAMSPPADARTLARRVHFDLIGLPPTPEELDTFVSDFTVNADKAYEALVDRLLASPRYGERWARHWLDVVHYGDTHGYDKDKPRPNAWPYRDYVIRALNDDKPYARFIQEQIAGDVLYPGTADGIEALGFLAAGPWDFIGHAEVPESKIDGKIARHLDRDDMVGTAVGALASVTVQCAQCHSHKFDPISQEDYYALQAVFAAIDRTDKTYDLDPVVAASRSRLTARKAEMEAEQKALAAKIKTAGGAELADLDKQIASAESAAPQGRRPEYGWHSGIAKDQETRKWVQVDLGKSVAIQRVVLAGVWDDFNGIGAGFGFPVRFRIEASDDPAFGGTPTVIAAHDLEDYANPGTTPRTFVAGGKSARYVRVTATKLAPRKGDFIFALAELQAFDAENRNAALGAAVTSIDSVEAPVRWRRSNLTDDVYPAKTGGGADLAALRDRRDKLMSRVTDAAIRTRSAALAGEIASAAKELSKLPPPRVVFAGAIHTGRGAFAGTGPQGGKPRPIFLLARGQVTQPGKPVGPGALSAVKSLRSRFEIPDQQGEGVRRAALARWLTDPANPLTWRSIVNRVWQYHFGKGIVLTPNDFGRMGTPPTHPELLDWLAADFRDSGGSLKRLHKLIVTSAAYRQSSSADNAGAVAVDVDNNLLWRQNRRKLEAEAVRDAVLAASGKLDLTMGGPGWQDFIVEHPEHSPHYRYDKADPNDVKTWRRSIYRFTVRSQLQPFMTSLDCADPSMRVDKRNESVSPAQALALLNNGFMVTQAEAMAARLWQDAGADGDAQIDRACRLTLARVPTAAEREQMKSFVRTSGLPNLCRVLLNLNEFVFVD
ncbi:DUF1553 domain-containing protein [Humisphaera borealis]|uniref:DUF1553 domain-containing protein n=1 Tax=Humisphaera borealis TaxID=2807512 RepID=A0A7M2WTJ8_9BACT|nr:DUF1553 domain-containing protein [Humisphaera borealis]QOV88847.1 DUF1553 domain-containing protein [Humisphaera borealis]